jgi:hypothetical protein
MSRRKVPWIPSDILDHEALTVTGGLSYDMPLSGGLKIEAPGDPSMPDGSAAHVGGNLSQHVVGLLEMGDVEHLAIQADRPRAIGRLKGRDDPAGMLNLGNRWHEAFVDRRDLCGMNGDTAAPSFRAGCAA